MNDDSGDLYQVHGSKVWLSPTAVAYAREYFGPGRKGREQFARYLQLRHQMQTAALSPPGIGVHSDELSSYLAPPPVGRNPIWRYLMLHSRSTRRSTRRSQ